MSEREYIEALKRLRENIIKGRKPVFLTTEKESFTVLDVLERTNDALLLLAKNSRLFVMQVFKRNNEEQIKQIGELIKEDKLAEITADYIGARIQYIEEVKPRSGELDLDYEYGIIEHSRTGTSVWINVLDKNTREIGEQYLAFCYSRRSAKLLTLPDGTLIKFVGNVRKSSSGPNVVDLMYFKVIEEEPKETEAKEEEIVEEASSKEYSLNRLKEMVKSNEISVDELEEMYKEGKISRKELLELLNLLVESIR